jgi:hypothetical protein
MLQLVSLLKRVLPYPLLRFLGFARGLFRWRVSYSQYGEDLIVQEYFQKAQIDKGVYLDIGAFHPTWISNTHLLHRKGWTGHVVDIDSEKILAFRLMRGDKVKTYCAAISTETCPKKNVTVYKFDMAWSRIDTLSLEDAEIFRKRGGTYKKVTINTIAINDLLALLGKINFLNIDVEGMDDAILMAMNFDANSPELIVFEDNHHWGGSPQAIQKLERLGYRHLFTSAGSVGYCKPL